ncbi:two-component system OmpR family response regulator [Halalkalibacter nanhaiisediminis]|uniref:Two-component system OmpR family response regulator n=2 Tax=Halalkalibacter nanhaiisediminis TaxID=688079 RepID=A0A562QKF9_9BACI|nr:two-component system OmpR family response regulator [Halalkalibacter nanhaiisediminis]
MMKDTRQILIVDDEADLRKLVGSYLEKESYFVQTAKSGEEAIHILQQYHSIDLVVLDVMMDDMDGFTACEKIREFSMVPILMLTARSSEEDKIKGLKVGADDYIVKPFSPRELVARIEAALRRVDGLQTNKQMIKVQELEVDKNGRIIYLQGKPINATRKEFDLLLYLLEHRGQVFTREQLHERLWGMDSQMGTLRTVDTHIKTLRLKLKSAERHIKTVWGVGYKFEDAQ